ncbi:MAG: hypothetical protein WCL21_16945 [Mariniphaga sp.]
MNIFEPIMKIVLFCLVNLLVMIHPAYSFAQEVMPAHNFGVVQQEALHPQVIAQTDNLYCDDDLLDFNDDDDDINDNERKHFALQESVCKIIFFVIPHSCHIIFNRYRSAGYSFCSQASLFIFLRVFRI